MAADERFLSALILAVTAVFGFHVGRVADRRGHQADARLARRGTSNEGGAPHGAFD